MSRRKFTDAELEERQLRRAQVREGLILARAELRAWREDRVRRASKRQRGHQSRRVARPRRRDMPGAIDRRLDRAKAEWNA